LGLTLCPQLPLHQPHRTLGSAEQKAGTCRAARGRSSARGAHRVPLRLRPAAMRNARVSRGDHIRSQRRRPSSTRPGVSEVGGGDGGTVPTAGTRHSASSWTAAPPSFSAGIAYRSSGCRLQHPRICTSTTCGCPHRPLVRATSFLTPCRFWRRARSAMAAMCGHRPGRAVDRPAIT